MRMIEEKGEKKTAGGIGETGKYVRARAWALDERGGENKGSSEREREIHAEGKDVKRVTEEGVGKIGRNSLDVHGPAREPRSLPLSFSHVFFALSFLPLVRSPSPCGESCNEDHSRMAHAASDNVNEKSYILDARKNFEDVSKVIKKSISPCPDVVYHIDHKPDVSGFFPLP